MSGGSPIPPDNDAGADASFDNTQIASQVIALRGGVVRGRIPDAPITPPPVTESSRKFRAKRVNEQIKSFYSIANTLGAAIIVAAAVLPAIRNECGPNELDRPAWMLVGIALHALGHLAIRYGTQKEE